MSARLDTSVLNVMLAKLPVVRDANVAKVALSVAADTQKNIRGWPLVDTGALLNSIAADKIGPGRWRVHDGVEYGIYWELGHRNLFLRRYVRKPFMTPAIHYIAAKFEQMITKGMFS